jgi:hypothetical protein
MQYHLLTALQKFRRITERPPVEGLKWFTDLISQAPVWVKVIIGSGTAVLLIGIVLLFVTRSSPAAVAPNPPKQSSPAAVAANSLDDQTWLKVGPVQVFGRFQELDPSIQVEADVNGTKYMYPSLSGVKWLKIGPAMAPQIFAVPKSPRYEVQFVANLNVKGKTQKLVSQRVVRISSTEAKDYTGKYLLYPLGEAGSRGASVNMEVTFSLSTNPN